MNAPPATMNATHFATLQDSLLLTVRKQEATYGRAVTEEMWSHGFLPDKTTLYAIEEHGLGAYLSDLQRFVVQLNGPLRPILDNKVIFDKVYAGVVRTAPLLGYTANRRFVGDLPHSGVVYAKPMSGSGGVGVRRAVLDGDRVTVRDQTTTREAFLADLVSRQKTFIVNEGVEQHPEMNELYDGTVNTIRVLMMRPPDGGEGFVAGAVLRVGSRRSGQVDNFGGGGISFAIDLDTGTLGGGWEKRGVQMEAHPDTGAPITGRRLPLWNDVLETCHRAFEHCHMIYVGWDVIVSPDGPVVLEGNTSSDVNLMQVHRPLLIDDRIREFYDHYGILDVRPNKPVHAPADAGAQLV
ncbi:MAG TPA: sugar-transfer associated ATP-grasp domain-containing protein [Solirubrobacteraceae bacterium]|jgi:hypothetical protein